MEFLIGFIGALVAVGLFVGGCFLGWHLRDRDLSRTQRVTAEELSEQQKRRLADEREAWKSLHNYSVEDAYGMRPEPATSTKE